VQVVNAASQWPAQATPFGAKFRIDVSLEVKVMVTFRVVPEDVWAAAAKLRTLPSVKDVALEGDRLIFPGNKGLPGLLLPHPARFKRQKMPAASHTPQERNLPMYSSLFKFINGSRRPELDSGPTTG
jgi:hypothetical protein